MTTAITLKIQTHPPRKGADGSVRLSARVSPGDPAGTLQSVVDGQPVGDPVPVRGGNVSGPVTPLGPGQHSVSAAFTPSTSDTVTFTFSPIIPAEPRLVRKSERSPAFRVRLVH